MVIERQGCVQRTHKKSTLRSVRRVRKEEKGNNTALDRHTGKKSNKEAEETERGCWVGQTRGRGEE